MILIEFHLIGVHKRGEVARMGEYKCEKGEGGKRVRFEKLARNNRVEWENDGMEDREM